MIVKRIRFYSDGEKKEKKIKLSDIQSHRGLGRSLFIGGLHGAVGGLAGKNEADIADEEGASDTEIIRRASKKGAKVGGAVGAGMGAASSIPYVIAGAKGGGIKGAAFGLGSMAGLTAIGGAQGALGGYLGANKNARKRTEKRRILGNSRR